MSINAENYNSANIYLFDIAKKLVTLVNKYCKDDCFETIVDIGIGSGNVSQMVARSLKHGHIYGLDVDTNMIEFSNKNKTIDSIEYLLTDLSGDWNAVNPTIRNLQSKVSLVFSNMVIDLIREKSIFAQNVKRLLKEKGQKGRAFFTFPIFPELLAKVSSEEKQFYEQYVRVPEGELQVKVWTDIFESNGFRIEHQEIEDPVWTLQTKDVLAFLPFMPIILDTWTTEGRRFKDLPEQIQTKLMALSMDAFCNFSDNQLNMLILDQMKNGDQTKITDCNWRIVYLVCSLK